jgi:hypothetical protein
MDFLSSQLNYFESARAYSGSESYYESDLRGSFIVMPFHTP